MLSIESKTHRSRTCAPNVLPCRVHHNGPVNATERYWSPRTDAGKSNPGGQAEDASMLIEYLPDGKTMAYFRGRELHGKKAKIPDGYRGRSSKVTRDLAQLISLGRRRLIFHRPQTARR